MHTILNMTETGKKILKNQREKWFKKIKVLKII